MRETCARVLAAALMTGAIGFVLAMPAVFGTAHDAVRSLTSPPSSLQRSVHVVASALPRPVHRFLEPAHSITRAVPAAGVAVFSPPPTSPSVPKPAAQPTPQPTPQPVTSTDTRALAGDTPAAPATPPAENKMTGGKRKGKSKGREKGKKSGTPAASESQPLPAAPPPPPAGESPSSDDENNHGHDGNKGKSGNDKRHDK
ncbi:MAG TPA: hypothetical protein VIM33_10335 [Gaiellaceae bacterium]